MAKVNLGDVELIDTIQDTDNVLVETGGSVRRVSLSKLLESESGKTVADDLATALANLIPQSGLGNAYIKLVNSDEGESVVTINGESVTIGAGQTYEGYVDDWSAITTNNLKSVVAVGNFSATIGSNSYNYTIESVQVYFASDYRRSMQYLVGYLSNMTKCTVRGGIATSMQGFIQHSEALTALDGISINTSQAANWQGCFAQSNKCTRIDTSFIDFSSATSLYALFQQATRLAEVDLSHTVPTNKCTNLRAIFGNDGALQRVAFGVWDLSGVTNYENAFIACSALTTVTGTLSGIKLSLSLSDSPLTRESALVFINGLSDEPSEENPTLSLSSTTKALLTDDDIAIATNKGWTIA